jgi:hypothetical protein
MDLKKSNILPTQTLPKTKQIFSSKTQQFNAKSDPEIGRVNKPLPNY